MIEQEIAEEMTALPDVQPDNKSEEDAPTDQPS